MRENDDLLNTPCKSYDFLARPQCTMLIEAGHRVVDHNNFVLQVRVFV